VKIRIHGTVFAYGFVLVLNLVSDIKGEHRVEIFSINGFHTLKTENSDFEINIKMLKTYA
jgi:hypothetical protein